MLKEIHMNMRIEFMPNELDFRGNKFMDWPINETRGNNKYDPPLGWIGIGLKVIDKYDSGNNTWIGKNNSKGEWAVAYHPIEYARNSEETKRILEMILRRGFLRGCKQVHRDCEDKNHPGKKVGEGVYFISSIKIAEMYAGITQINGKNYKIILMVRFNPNSFIRKCKCLGDERFVIDGNSDEVRAYRILFKAT